ncbi:unnamed protein product [Orchesella dallaii]|uniref:Uncharacterized protein n=1 Tax=Orchesella dallaii TaxID=48710 RepID=A0ABP1PR86_9HEXA
MHISHNILPIGAPVAYLLLNRNSLGKWNASSSSFLSSNIIAVIMIKIGCLPFVVILALLGLRHGSAFTIIVEKPDEGTDLTQDPLKSEEGIELPQAPLKNEEWRKWIREQEKITFQKVIEKISSPNDTSKQHEAKVAVARYLVNVTFTVMTRRLENFGRGVQFPETPLNIPIPPIPASNPFPATQSYFPLPAAPDSSDFSNIPHSHDPLSSLTLANKTSAPFSPVSEGAMYAPPSSALSSLPSSASNDSETTMAPANSRIWELLGIQAPQPGGLFGNLNISSLPERFNISGFGGGFNISSLPQRFNISGLGGRFNISGGLPGGFNLSSLPGNLHLPPEGLFNVPTPTPQNDSVRLSQMFLEHQVGKLVEDINMRNISGIVDSTAYIATPQTVGVLVNALLNIVLCNPLDRFYGNCGL